jgi:hypothetical protein
MSEMGLENGAAFFFIFESNNVLNMGCFHYVTYTHGL